MNFLFFNLRCISIVNFLLDNITSVPLCAVVVHSTYLSTFYAPSTPSCTTTTLGSKVLPKTSRIEHQRFLGSFRTPFCVVWEANVSQKLMTLLYNLRRNGMNLPQELLMMKVSVFGKQFASQIDSTELYETYTKGDFAS